MQDFTCAENIDGFSKMSAYGGTPLGQAVNEALNKLENRKSQYKKTGTPYYQPWLVIISDGYPNDYDWEQAADKAKNLASQRKLVSLPIGVQGADLSALQRFSNKPAVALQGLKFREFFSWIKSLPLAEPKEIRPHNLSKSYTSYKYFLNSCLSLMTGILPLCL